MGVERYKALSPLSRATAGKKRGKIEFNWKSER